MLKLKLFFVLMSLYLFIFVNASGQELTKTDTVFSDSIAFTANSAAAYIKELLELHTLWKPSGDTVKLSLTRLIDHYQEPFDSIAIRLASFQEDSVSFSQAKLTRKDTIPLRWLNDTTFIVDTVMLEKDPFITKSIVIKKIMDPSAFTLNGQSPDLETLIDYMLNDSDTIVNVVIDTAYLKSMNVQIHQIVNNDIIPPLLLEKSRKTQAFLPDSSKVVFSESFQVIIAGENTPFNILPGENMPDSLRQAVNTLLSYTSKRDSILLFINDIKGIKTPFWISTANEDLHRFWVKNFKNDSITIWMGNPGKNQLTLILEDDINVNRMEKVMADDIPIFSFQPERSLAKLEPLKPIPIYWNYKFSSSMALNQTYISNWAKGGENSLSGLFDISGSAIYTNKEQQTQWTSSIRSKYGIIITEEYGRRTNTDLLELNSQYNKVIKDKVDFSSVFYMKNQIAKGYKYPNDSVPVSKFLNPGTFTIGVGLEYKPFKNTSLNYSILSYKNTFVLDTARIKQTTHGIPKDRRSRQEMGGQLVVKNKVTIFDDLVISNSMRLFSSYLEKPENIDIDWEINLEKKINWYFTIMMNFHMIYDDDIKFQVLDKDEKPVLLPDGSQKKVAKLQFKQYMGLALLFKF
jgi:hypothetical protein